MATGAELDYDTGATALEMAETIMGDGVTVVGARYFGDNRSSGTYGDGDALAPGVTPADEGVILSTGRATNFTRSGGDPNRSGSTSTNTSGVNNDAQMNAAVGANTYDAAILEVDFIPTSDNLNMQFTFASEEFPEFSGSQYNDAVAVWVNGQLIDLPIIELTQVNNVNQNENANFFQDNTGDDFNTEMDGLTVTLGLDFPVNDGVINTVRIAVADTTDTLYDSAVLIGANSVQNVVDANDDTDTVLDGQTKTLDLLANDASPGATAQITQINGQDLTAGGSVTLADGTVVTLRADGSVDVTPPGLGGAASEDHSFTYTITDADGITDTAFVTVTAVPCFAAGTLIRTPRGDVAVETLQVGDLVETLDDGPQPVRWIGRRRVAATGRHAPVVIEQGTFGLHETLRLSPQHRVLIRDRMAELMFGADEVLVAAKDLVNGVSVRWQDGGEVEYVHVLFDRHQILWSAGLPTESFLPGPQTLPGFAPEVQAEICALFPELEPETGHGYGEAARRGLKAFEARALLA